MSLGDAVKATYRQYGDFLGRSGRAEYWLFILYTVIVTVVVSLLALTVVIVGSLGSIFLGADLGADAALGGAGASLIFLLVLLGGYVIWTLATLVPFVSSTVRRIRDAGLSGLFVLVILIPGFGNIILLVLTLLPSKNSNPGSSQATQESFDSPGQDLW